MAIASSAIEIRSPAVSSMSSSRPGGSSVIWLARSSSSSVRVAHRGDHDDDVVAVLLGARRSARRHASCARRRRRRNRRTSGRRGPRVHRLPTSARGPAVASPTGAGCDHPMDDPEEWLLSADERGNPATDAAGLDGGQPRRAPRARRHATSTGWSTRCGRCTPATTCSSPTGGAIPTSGCATDGPTVGRAVHRRGASGASASAGWSGARTWHRMSLQQGGEPRARRARSSTAAAR